MLAIIGRRSRCRFDCWRRLSDRRRSLSVQKFPTWAYCVEIVDHHQGVRWREVAVGIDVIADHAVKLLLTEGFMNRPVLSVTVSELSSLMIVNTSSWRYDTVTIDVCRGIHAYCAKSTRHRKLVEPVVPVVPDPVAEVLEVPGIEGPRCRYWCRGTPR